MRNTPNVSCVWCAGCPRAAAEHPCVPRPRPRRPHRGHALQRHAPQLRPVRGHLPGAGGQQILCLFIFIVLKISPLHHSQPRPAGGQPGGCGGAGGAERGLGAASAAGAGGAAGHLLPGLHMRRHLGARLPRLPVRRGHGRGGCCRGWGRAGGCQWWPGGCQWWPRGC